MSDDSTAGPDPAQPPPDEPPLPSVSSPPARARPRFLDRRVVRVGVGIGVAAALILAWSAVRNRDTTASPPDKGSCIWAEGTQTAHPTIHRVGCSDQKAQYTVLGKIPHGTESSCQSVAGTEFTFTSTTSDKQPVYVLCLQQVK